MRTLIILILGTLAFILAISESEDIKVFVISKLMALAFAGLTYLTAKGHNYEMH